MHVINDMSGDYGVGAQYIMNFRDFASTDPDDRSLLVCHGNAIRETLKRPVGYKRYVYIETEEPTTLLYHKKLPPDRPTQMKWSFDDWDLIPQTSSPSLTEYLNGVCDTDKYVPIMNPIHPKWHNPTAKKKYTVAYCGGTHECHTCHSSPNNMHLMLKKFVRVVREFPDSIHISAFGWADRDTLTHEGVPDHCKMQLLNETKIQIIKNSLFGDQFLDKVMQLPDWNKYKWTSRVHDNWVPQLKTRVAEGSICKNLMLVHRDPWNEIEHYLEPNKHFIYFNDADDLRIKIKECLDNWDEYKKIAENAYREYIRKHTSSALYHKLLQKWDPYGA